MGTLLMILGAIVLIGFIGYLIYNFGLSILSTVFSILWSFKSLLAIIGLVIVIIALIAR